MPLRSWPPLQRWLPKDQLQVHSPGFDHHNKDHPKNKHDPVLEIVTGLPSSIEQYVDFTMISQAEGLKFGIEHYRRREPHCGGTLIWQFNDVWPGFSWSVIDYAGVPKAGYHYARRAFAPTIASFCQGEDGELQLWICNSSAAAVSCEVEVTVGASRRYLICGGWRLRCRPDRPYSPGPYPAARTSRPRIAMPGYAVQTAHSTLTGASSARSKMWNSVSARLSPRSFRASADRAVVRVRATGFNYFVRIRTPAPQVRFSDNYLDLRDGDIAEITVLGLTEEVGDNQLRAVPV